MNPDLALTYCRMIAQALQVDGVALGCLLEGTSLTPEAFYASEGYLDWTATERFIGNVCRLDKRPDLALQVGLRAVPSMHGAIGLAITASATLREATRLFVRFINTRTRLFEVTLEETSTRLILHLQFTSPPGVATRFLKDSALASAYACQLALYGHAIEGSVVSFDFPQPANPDYYHTAFAGTQVEFGARQIGLSVPAAICDKPLPGHDSALLHLAVRQCEARQQHLRHSGLLADKVLNVLEQQAVQIRLEEVADQLHMSRRTLMRRLKSEGVSFQQLRDQTLSRRAAHLLALPHSTVESVAAELGYADAASFRRAHQRWFGRSPSEHY